MLVNLLMGLALVQVDSFPTTLFDAKEEITYLSADFKGNIYIGTINGRVIRLDPTTKQSTHFSLPNNSAVTFIEAWNPLRIFVFLEDIQSFLYLDRFIATSQHYAIDPQKIGFASLAFPAPDRSFWVLDQPLVNLHKYNEITGLPINVIPIKQVIKAPNIIAGRAFQDMILLLDKAKGLYVMDGYGQVIHHFMHNDCISMQLDHSSVWLFSNTHIYQLDMAKFTVQSELLMPVTSNLFLVQNDHLFFVENDKLNVIRLK